MAPAWCKVSPLSAGKIYFSSPKLFVAPPDGGRTILEASHGTGMFMMQHKILHGIFLLIEIICLLTEFAWGGFIYFLLRKTLIHYCLVLYNQNLGVLPL